MSYDIHDLRSDLAATIKALREGDEKMTIEKAQAINSLGQTIINSAKVEVDALRAVGTRVMQPTGFVPLAAKEDTLDKQERGSQTLLDAPPKPKPHVRNPMGTGPQGRI